MLTSSGYTSRVKKVDLELEDTNPAVPHPAPLPRFPLVDLARMHGQMAKTGVPDGEAYSALHLETATRHCWAKHEHNFGQLLFTNEEYLSALEASRQGTTSPAADRRF
jgi:hypothetical protein